MRSWSIPIGRVFGVELRIHWAFLVLMGLIVLNEASASAAAGSTPNPAREFALVGIFLFSVLFHEMGHALAAHSTGTPIRASMLLPIGGVHVLDEAEAEAEAGADTEAVTHASTDPGASHAASTPARTLTLWQRELRISLSGPLASFSLAAVTAFALFALGVLPETLKTPLIHSSHLLRSLFWVNLGLAGLNLLPAYPTDGGRLLRTWFALKTDYLGATRRAVTIGHTIAMISMLAGIVAQDIWLAMFGFSLFIGAQMEERSVIFHSVLESVRLDEVMLTEFASLSPADTLEDALERAVHSLQDDFPVIRGNAMVGVVTRQNILDALRLDGNGYVQSVMEKFYEVANRNETLASAFRKLNARKLTIIPVLEEGTSENGEGGQRLVGIVTLQNLMHSMTLLAESRKLKQSSCP